MTTAWMSYRKTYSDGKKKWPDLSAVKAFLTVMMPFRK